MKKLFLLILFSTVSFGQIPIDSILNFTLSYRGLTRNDITIPVDYFNAGEKSPTNGTQLILPLVRDMLNNPLLSIENGNGPWPGNLLDKILFEKDNELHKTVDDLMSILHSYYFVFIDRTGLYLPHDRIYSRIVSYKKLELLDQLKFIIKTAKNNKDTLLIPVSENEKRYLNQNLMSIFEESDDDIGSNLDVFKFNESRDSSISQSKRTMDIMSKFNREWIDASSFSLFEMCNFVYKYVKDSIDIDGSFDIKRINNQFVHGDFYYYYYQDGIRIAIGGPGHNEYHGQFDFIIDVGGDDYYDIEKSPPFAGHPLGQGGQGGFSCIIDLLGNDYYTTKSDFALAGALFSSSFIFDKSGDDVYDSKGNGNLGAAIGGLGLIYDEAGNDIYKSISFSIGAGCFGVGLVVDREGNDFYIANSYSQGFGMTEGVGCIVDNKGNDSYLVDSRSLDIGRYNDHYVSMCQGFGLGLRPYYAGGIGLIIEGEGNDIYNTDIFGQGGGYWYGLGAILDKSGHDKYNSYQYAQGSGIHIAVGLLKDYDGWDFYSSNGVSQGCGHDFGFGFLWDVKGNDNYSAYSLSQGAGNANGIGFLIDESGRDGYLNKEPGNTRGYGNPRREYGSLGIFLDASGDDFYSVAGLDSTINNSSTWGVSNDYFLADLPEQISGDNFKVEIDSVNRPHDISFSVEEYFIMAKTIEPRFSKWQDYGFRKLIDDSILSSAYLLTKFATDDHRDAQVMRVLITKIPKSISDAMKYQLNRFKKKETQLETKELSMMCYLMGESKNEIFKEDLLDLTYNENIRVKSTAVNALGKIKHDTTDAIFIEKVMKRFLELYKENSSQKILSKDLAFASKNFKTHVTILLLGDLLRNDYYGARFMAASGFKIFEDYFTSAFFMGMIDPSFLNNRTFTYSLLMSIQYLGEESFKGIIEFLLKSGISNDEIIRLNLIDALKSKKTSDKNEFQFWLDNKIAELNTEPKLKVR